MITVLYVIGGLTAGAVTLNRFYVWVLRPTWRFMKAVVAYAAMSKTLSDIAQEFAPNHGTSLRDVVDRLEDGQAQAHARLLAIENKIDTFLLQRKNGGRRSYDPKE